jgi:O-antigen/teichoic acid export membrane protein
MISLVKPFIKDSLVYGIGEFINRSTQLLILPLILIYLTPKEFGVLDYFLASRNILSVLFGWGVASALMKYGIDLKKYKFGEVALNATLVVFILDFVASILILISIDRISALLLSGDYFNEYTIIIITSSFIALRSIPLSIFRLKSRPLPFIMINAINMALYLSIAFILLRFYHLTYFSFLLANLISSFISLIIAYGLSHRFFSFQFNRSLIGKLLKFGLSILATSFTYIIISNSNRIFLKLNSGFEEIGILGMATRISTIIGAFIISPFNLAWLPYVLTNHNKVNFQAVVNYLFRLLSFLGIFLSLFLIYVGPFLFLFFNKIVYLDSFHYVPFYCLSFLALGYYYMFSAGIYLSGDYKKYYYISIWVIIFNFGMYFLLMPYLTLYLVSFITLASHILMSWLAYFWGNSFIKIKVIQKKQGHLILAALLIILPYLNLIKNTFTLDAEKLFVSLLFLISIFYLWKTEFFKIDKAYDN